MEKYIAVGLTTQNPGRVCDFVKLKTHDVQYQYKDLIWLFIGPIDQLEEIRGSAAISWKTFFIADDME